MSEQEGGWAGFQQAQCGIEGDGHCITCSDEALTVVVLQVDQALGLALVGLDESTAEVDISLVDELRPGQRLLVHAGVAIGLVEE